MPFCIKFYKDSSDNEPVKEYILTLASKRDKDSRIKLNKIQDYIQILSEYGTHAPAVCEAHRGRCVGTPPLEGSNILFLLERGFVHPSAPVRKEDPEDPAA